MRQCPDKSTKPNSELCLLSTWHDWHPQVHMWGKENCSSSPPPPPWLHKMIVYFTDEITLTWLHSRTGPVSFRGGGGGWGQLPEYFLHCLPENQVVLPEYYMIFFFARKWLFEKFGGGGGAAPPHPSASYAYMHGWYWKYWHTMGLINTLIQFNFLFNIIPM